MEETKKKASGKSFDAICKEYEKLDPLTYKVILSDKASTLIPALNLLSEDGVSGSALFFQFLLVNLAADNNLSAGEYEAMEPAFKAFFCKAPSYKEVTSYLGKVKKEEEEAKKEMNDFVDKLGKVSPKMKEDLVVVAFLICGMDGKIDAKEKAWIQKLIA